MKVGFVGLGTMGLPMTLNLIKAGFEVYVCSRSRGPIESAVAAGASECANPAELAHSVDCVLTCLPMPKDVEQVYLGKNGLFEGASSGQIFADHSTVGPQLSRKLYEFARTKGASFIDAPVSGGPMGAKAGTLTIMCGGQPEAFEQGKPVFEAIGQKVLLMGPSGSGSITKLINNQLFGIHTVALAEAMVLAQKTEIDLNKMYSVLQSSTGNSAILDWVYPAIMNHQFSPRFTVDLLLKDMKIAGEVGTEAGLELPVAKTACSQVQLTQQQGFGSSDVSAVFCPLEEKYL